MGSWRQFPELAVFPGCLLFGDDRSDDASYPSTPFTAEQLAAKEPALTANACKDGARLYSHEGMPPLQNNTWL